MEQFDYLGRDIFLTEDGWEVRGEMYLDPTCGNIWFVIPAQSTFTGDVDTWFANRKKKIQEEKDLIDVDIERGIFRVSEIEYHADQPPVWKCVNETGVIDVPRDCFRVYPPAIKKSKIWRDIFAT